MTSTDPQRSAPAAARSSWSTATLGPFRSRIFLAIWTATLVSHLGSLIQAVGASWLMTTLAPSADMVALVQASTALPIMLLSLPAGAIADIWDRRIIMLIAQSLMLLVSAALAVLAFMDGLTPWTLLGLTFLIGCGMALYGPAWQSSVGEQVPRPELPAAVALNTVAFNIARTLGPAIGGVVVATGGPPAAFVINGLSYVALIAVLASWQRPRPNAVLPPESMGMAMSTGLRYARLSPGIRAVIVRSMVYGLLGSAIWALMPLIARDLIGGGPLTYGILFGAFGGGAVLGALVSTWIRQRHSNERVVRAASIGFGLSAAIVALSTWHVVSFAALVVGGMSWVLALSTFNITVQTSSPRWVVGRAMATYQMVTFGGLALGSWLWGEIAESWGLVTSLLASGIAMLVSALLGWWLRLPQAENLDLAPSRKWQEPQPRVELVPESGPVVVTVEYRIAPEDRGAFAAAMMEVRRIRRRDGARRWTLLQDIDDPDLWIERFHSPTWVEHLRRRHRITVADREIERRALSFHRGPEPPKIRHLLQQAPGSVAAASASAAEPRAAAATDPNLPPAGMPLADTAREEP